MKPAMFDYFAPSSVDEAVALLAEHGEDAKVLAGGQSLVPLMNMRLARPRVVVDLNRVADLAFVERTDDGLRIGAMTRQRAVETSAVCAARAPLLREAVGYIGHTAIRTRGTIGGSLAHADPAAELPAVITALDAELVARGPASVRTIAPGQFFQGYLTTALAPDEILTEIRLPSWPEGAGWAFMEISRRHGDFAIVGVACVIQADSSGRCTDARVVLTGVGPAPYVSGAAREVLIGQPLSDDLFVRVQEAVAADGQLQPESDIHASAIYRKEVAGVIAKRALRLASTRLGKSLPPI